MDDLCQGAEVGWGVALMDFEFYWASSSTIQWRAGSVPLSSISQFISGFSTLFKLSLRLVAGF